MPKRPPVDAEQVRISPEDADVLDFFIIRRSYNPDGTMRYVQLIGDAQEIEDFASGQPVTVLPRGSGKHRAASLARIIMQRVLGRPLEREEFIRPKNGLNGDLRRGNLEIATRSDLASVERDNSWSSTGQKYIYADANGRFYINKGDQYLGTYDTVEQAAVALKMFEQMVASGMSDAEAERRLKSRARNSSKITIE